MPDNHTEWLAPLAGNPIWWLFSSWRIKPRSRATERLSLRKYWCPVPPWYDYQSRSCWHSHQDKDQSGIQSPLGLPRVAGTKVRKAEWYYCHRICAKDACDIIAQISGHRTITVRKQFLAKDLRLINQAKKKSRKRPGVSRTVSQETILDNTTMMGMCHSWHICPNPQEWIPRQGFAPVCGGMEGLDCSCAEDDGWGLGGYAYVREGQVETIHTLCSVLLHL